MAVSPTASLDPAVIGRVITWRTLVMVYVASIVAYTFYGLAFRVHNFDATSVGSDEALFVIGTAIAVAVLSLVTLLVHRFGSPLVAGRTGVGLGVLAAVVYVPLFFLPWSLVWGVGAVLLGEEAGPGRARTAARVFGAIAVLEVVVVSIAWLMGSGWHPGCSPQDCHPR